MQSVVHVKGKSINTSETMAVYLSHDEKINVSELNVINVNVGLGSLSESLGKGIASPSVNATTTSIAAPHGVADLLDENFVEQSNHLTKELKEIYKELENASTNQNLKKWERIVIPYLKGESWETISKSIKKIRPEKGQQKQQTVAKDYEFKVFEVEKDRIIDYNFIHSITSLIFKVEAGEVCFNNTFIPEHSLTYLFTHPLYPKEFTNGLLLLFSRRAEEIEEDGKNGIGSLRLLRQALITCPNLSCLEIAKQLNNSNDEIFQDVVSRLVEEYSVNQISSTLLDILNGANSKLNLEECIKKCYILDNGWEIMPAIIDAGGLFGWSKGLINKIIEDVELQLESLNLNTYNLTFTNQAILVNSALDNATGTTHGKKSKKSKKKAKKEQQHQQNLSNGNSIDFDLNDIIESNKQQDQLNSILTINNTSRKNLLDDGISLSKKIPVYSVEKLIL